MRRTAVVWCSGGPYHVPTLARVALFPIHLDPPTRQHRELFRLLLGAPDLATPTWFPPVPPTLPTVSSSSLLAAPPHGSLSTSAGATPAASAAGLRGRLHSVTPPHTGKGAAADGGSSLSFNKSAAAAAAASNNVGSGSAAAFPNDDDPISCSCSSPFWYMEAFATSLREDSQLAPFDDIILIPNTRGPVSLRQSTHLAALAVLATRGLAHVHVDFTALEHPDDTMPIIYELVCKYTNSVLVHWLQDAYEMQNWSHFAEFKNTVPMLLLQTQSYPPRAVERQRPLGSVSRLTSRQYHSPVGPYVRSPEEAEYYRGAERFIQASMKLRRRNPTPMALTGGRGCLDTDMQERYESASLVNRESDYFDDVPDLPPHRRRAEEASPPAAAWQGDESDVKRGTPPPNAYGHVSASSPLPRQGQTTTSTHTASASGGLNSNNNTTRSSNSNGSSVQRSSSAGHDRLGLRYTDCAKGRWWNTPGGRGDDEVELSRAYWTSTSSSWLGGGGTGATTALPEWMEEVGAAAARLRSIRRFTEDHATTMNVSDLALAVADDGSAPEAGVTSVTPEGDRCTEQSLDTVVSDDGFALAVEEQTDAEPTATASSIEAARTSLSDSSQQAKQGVESASSAATEVSCATVRENADEDTRKRYLTREIEDVRKMLDGMLRPAGSAPTTAAYGSAAPAVNSQGVSAVRHDAANKNSKPVASAAAASTSATSARSGDVAGTQARMAGRAFGVYEAHHHDIHSHVRRRHRTVRQLIEELFPPRICGPVASASVSPTGIGAMEDGLQEYYGEGGGHASSSSSSQGNSSSSSSGGGDRAVSAASIFNTAVKTTPTHFGFIQQGTAPSNGNSNSDGSISISSSNAVAGAPVNGSVDYSNLYSWIDSPMVEVHPITRSTGADVRQALWEQEIHPSSILMDCVQRYMEGHGLYRDPRKATAASLYPGGSANEFSGATRDGGAAGGVGGPGGQLGVALEVSGGFRDPATAGGGSAGGGGTAVGNTVDGRSGVRRVAPRETSTLSFPGLIPRLELHYDRNNLLAREQFEKLRIFQCQDGEEPDLIVPIGGDGYMMHCIRKNWRRFIPFYGVNAGHVGYLLNDRSTLEELFSSPLKLHFTTMLYCQAEKEGDTGERMMLSELAFNDAWVERSSGQTALIRILVNGQERIRRLRGDGVLVSTAAGSTAYSQALGASPVPVGAPLIQVVGSNVVSPAQWRPAHLDQEDQVEFEVIDSTKRPCRCYVDSVDVGNVTRLLVRSSRVAGVTLAFSKSCDLQHKLYQMQFPKTL